MKIFAILTLCTFIYMNADAQLLKKLKQKAEEAVTKKADKIAEKKPASDQEEAENTEEATSPSQKPAARSSNLKVYSKFDFVPGSTILYFDNFEKDNIGETPLGWITSSAAEVVTIDGLEGNWLKMASTSARHISRNKKQSWGNNFTIEFDLLIVKNDYDPRIDINLIHTGGNMVTDENILRDGTKPAINFSAIIGADKQSRASLYAFDKKLSDAMSESLPYGNTAPVHVSMCVQGKRFRMWWNDRKLYDLSAVNEEFMPNQLQFAFGHVGGSEFYLSNVRVAKDIPDTRAKFEEGKVVSNLLFFTGTAKLKPESMGALLDISKILKDATEPVKIIGHTDSDGEDAANLKLSQQRAEAVKEILVSQYNIDADKLSTAGRGETQPIAENKSAEGKAQNRRVEFIFKAAADNYTAPAGMQKAAPSQAKTVTANSGNSTSGAATVSLQSKILTTTLPFAQFIKTGENSFSFIASKEEGNSKENFIKVSLETLSSNLKPETFNFEEINKTNPMFGVKKFPTIKKTEAVLFYGSAEKPYIYQLSPVVANGHMATFFTESLSQKYPPASASCKFVIEKVEGGKASGYFTAGSMIEGLKPITKGDAMQQTFTNGFAGEVKFTFSNVPVY